MPLPRLEPPQLPTSAVPCRKESDGKPVLPSVPLPHPPRFTAPTQGKSEKHTEAPHQRQRERCSEGNKTIGINEEREKAEEKKPESLSNFRDKRTVSQQTKWPAEVARMGLARPLRGTRRTEPAGAGRGRPAGRGGGSPAAPGPLSRPLRAPHFTPRRPRPRLCGAGNTPCRPDRTCSFPATPSLPSGRRPAGARKNRRGARAHLRPGCAQLAVAGGGAPSPGAQREGPGACSGGSEAWAARCSQRQGAGAMQTSGHLAWTPVRRRGSCSRGSRMRRGRQRGPEAWGTGRGAVLRDREKERGREEA